MSVILSESLTDAVGRTGRLSIDWELRGLWRSLVSALVWGTRGRGFKSRQPDHENPVVHFKGVG